MAGLAWPGLSKNNFKLWGNYSRSQSATPNFQAQTNFSRKFIGIISHNYVLTRVGDDDGGCVVLDLLCVTLRQVGLLLQLLELGLVLRPLRPAQLLLGELKQTVIGQSHSLKLFRNIPIFELVYLFFHFFIPKINKQLPPLMDDNINLHI